VHKSETTFLFGYGYGFHLGSLGPYNIAEDTRTPHNVFFYALGYGGWIGVSLFLAFQICLVRLLWLSDHLTGQPFGISFWALSVVVGSFGNFFETPFGAIPFYLIVGMLLAPVLLPKKVKHAHPVIT
jgi:O-antigen ligase